MGMLGIQRARMSKSKSSPSIRRVSSFQNKRINRNMDDMSASTTAALMWQCACTISSARSVLQRANANSLKYYTLTHIDSMSPEKLHKSADHKMREDAAFADLTIIEDSRTEDTGFEMDVSSLQMDDFYPNFPAYYY